VTSTIVLDASALLALIFEEQGSDVVAPHIESAAISSVNLAEAASKMIDRGQEPDVVTAMLSSVRLHVVPFDAELALASARLRATTRKSGLSLGDRACIVTAQALGVPAMTGDGEWARLDLGVEIRLIR
jgi:PIN domain nuclease of toxin-antitoxin system